ncbi:MAG TPA: hypothetical protein VFT16_00315 [Candidatus Saccharimonadales bacterium]|nr:hypothetical protein [Candidatus Saccharimonadales bacterium]
MATRLKTVQYAFPTLASLTNNTLTTLTQITVYLPEATKTFRKVIARVSCDDIVTATGGSLNNRTTNLRLGAAAYTSVANANAVTHSGLNTSHFFTSDFTSHFTTNWTGTSMTCDVQVLINQNTGTTLGMVNVCVTLDITYEYDDSAATQLKTVWIPLDAPTGALGTAKPGGANATIPALDTYLPEASKTYRDIHIVVQGNEARNALTTDHTLSMQIDALTALTSGNYEGALASDRFFRYVWDINSLGMTTNATHDFFIWASVGRVNHPQVWMLVTYEFDASTTTTAIQSLMLPMEFASPMGGTTSADYQRATRELWVEEPGTITLQSLAFFMHWDQLGNVAGLSMRIGTGSFVAYTDTASVLAGGNCCMIRNDAGASLARGRNSLSVDVYRTDAADVGTNVCGFWIVNYTSSVHSSGIGAHNKTILWNINAVGTAAANNLITIAATAPIIPEANYFLTANGTKLEYSSHSTVAPAGVNVLAERTAAEGGVRWEPAYVDIGETDPEAGMRTCYSQTRELFKRWTGDVGADRMDFETSRRWVSMMSNNSAGYHTLDLLFTYHTITFSVADSISGGFSGTVTLTLCRSSTGEAVLTTTRSGDGSFSFTWYDNTEELFVSANDGTNVGRSADSLAS